MFAYETNYNSYYSSSSDDEISNDEISNDEIPTRYAKETSKLILI